MLKVNNAFAKFLNPLNIKLQDYSAARGQKLMLTSLTGFAISKWR